MWVTHTLTHSLQEKKKTNKNYNKRLRDSGSQAYENDMEVTYVVIQEMGVLSIKFVFLSGLDF